MGTTTKTRPTARTGSLGGSSKQWKKRISDGVWVMDVGYPAVAATDPGFHGMQITTSEGHDWPPSGGLRDVGGPFTTTRRDIKYDVATVSRQFEAPIVNDLYSRIRFQAEGWRFRCPVSMVGGKPAFPTAQNSTDSSLNSWGAKAVSSCRPTAAEVDLSTALGETFTDGIPSIVGSRTWRDRTLRARNAGDEYLNVEFGWLPLVSDITALGHTVKNSDAIISQYERDRGRLVRRSFSFPEIRTVTTTDLGLATAECSNLTTSGFTGATVAGKWSLETTTLIKRWFKGGFVYGAPLRQDNVGSSATSAEIADRLFNASLSPDTLWNLTPWSWAIDWATNIGDVLAYAGDVASQGLVMQYGYIMEHTSREYKYKLSGASKAGVPIPELTTTVVTETKSRRAANPFGFGVTWSGLSAAQASILAALGISRA